MRVATSSSTGARCAVASRVSRRDGAARAIGGSVASARRPRGGAADASVSLRSSAAALFAPRARALATHRRDRGPRGVSARRAGRPGAGSLARASAGAAAAAPVATAPASAASAGAALGAVLGCGATAAIAAEPRAGCRAERARLECAAESRRGGGRAAAVRRLAGGGRLPGPPAASGQGVRRPCPCPRLCLCLRLRLCACACAPAPVRLCLRLCACA